MWTFGIFLSIFYDLLKSGIVSREYIWFVSISFLRIYFVLPWCFIGVKFCTALLLLNYLCFVCFVLILMLYCPDFFNTCVLKLPFPFLVGPFVWFLQFMALLSENTGLGFYYTEIGLPWTVKTYETEGQSSQSLTLVYLSYLIVGYF